MQNSDPYFGRVHFQNRFGQHIHGTLHIRLDNHIQFFKFTRLDFAEEIFQGDLAMLCQQFFPFLGTLLLGNILGFGNIFEHIKRIARQRNFIQAGYFHRRGRAGFFDDFAPGQNHLANLSVGRPADDNVALLQRPVFDQKPGQNTFSRGHFRFDDPPDSRAFGPGFQLPQFRDIIQIFN
ncbi:MAG: hypothetical protein BWY71_01121 [Planctomycetes bacterium ADurb.Bin412]|nr:MAG: hypothetical protein BWY71_01121 [Planctomycetes bacterium ADurb.Bin412]